MPDSYFTLLDETDLTGRYLAGTGTRGPWADHLQHGGPPNALAVAAAERAVRAHTGRDDLVAVRLAADFVGAVPVAEVGTVARVIRAARSAALVEVTVSSAGRDCLVARVWFVRDADTTAIASPLAARPLPDLPAGLDADFGFAASLEWRLVSGGMSMLGPGTVWVRPTLALIDDREVSGLARVALIADSASGISTELDWAEWSYVNVDLDIHLARPVEGEWILLDAVTQLGDHGCGMARSTLSDVRGVLGAGLQTLLLAPVTRGSGH